MFDPDYGNLDFEVKLRGLTLHCYGVDYMVNVPDGRGVTVCVNDYCDTDVYPVEMKLTEAFQITGEKDGLPFTIALTPVTVNYDPVRVILPPNELYVNVKLTDPENWLLLINGDEYDGKPE